MKRSRTPSSHVASLFEILLVAATAALLLAACGASETLENSSSSAAPSATVPQAAITDYPATPLPTPTVAGAVVYSKALKTTKVFRSDLYIVNTDGSGLKRLTDAPAMEEHPTWSPDGRRIAYGQYETSGFGENPTTASIWVMDADGSHKVRLTKGAVHGSWPVWSPDGKLIAFGWSSPKDDLVRVIRPDGSGLKTVGKLSAFGDANWSEDPVLSGGLGWTPDGRIVVVKAGEVCAVNVDGSGLTPLTKDAQLGSFSLSPDGAKFTLESAGQLRIVPVQGGGPEVLITTLVNYLFPEPRTVPSWSPDAKHLALTGCSLTSVAGSSIYIINADGSGLSAIPGVTAARDAAWRPE
jgi:dipeptidyl aminopeptidase/acylaminoacyl peptidase